MSSIDSLLNHEPTAAHRRSSQSDPHNTNTNTNTTTTFDAADALTTLATLGSGQQYAPAPPTRELPSPTASTSHAPRRTSSFGSSSQHAPIEPEPPIDLPQQHSPTLEHYHHGSRSPEEQKRRQSLLASRSSPAPVLAPIQNLSAALQSHTTQHREPASAPDESASSQTRPSEISALSLHPISTNLPLTQEQLPSPQPFIKNEPTGTPRESTPAATSIAHQTTERQPSASTENFDADTLKALEIAKQSDLGLRAKRNTSVTDSIPSPVEPKPAPATAAPAPSKKRPAPSSTAAVKKKGTATVSKKPAPKKRKLDTDGDSKARSVTPTSRSSKPSKTIRKGSQAGTPVAGSSPAPDNSSQAQPSDDDAESSEDDALYCICKKPDNHKWMIGCDGGCDDWFHGDCVDMRQSDEDLVDKFICPLCEKAGRGTTTWKPMCRREGCRKPARLTKGKESKYCSDECGVLFMTEQLQRTAGAKGSSKRKPKKKGMSKQGEEGGDHASDDEDEPTPLGGVLRAKDLKALVDSSPNIQAFRNLGSGVLSPPQTASPTQASFNGMPKPNEDLSLTAAETERLNALHNEKTQLKDRLEVLKDREKFVSMTKEQATRVAEREKIKGKEFCGYDSRLSWSDAEFLLWRNSKHGRASFQYGTLAPTEEQVSSMPCVNGEDRTTTPPTTGDLEKESVCLKKRCQKHPQWQKLNLQDARFEELEIVEAIKECEKEERSVRERARRRCAKDEMAKELTAGERGPGAAKERNRDGWVEVVGS